MPRSYHAFISYSHADESWARWLHRSLERYRVPKRLIGTQGAFGPVPERLSPIFRDREELASSGELGTVIENALDSSRALIVICSPRSAGSHWVGQEIAYFKHKHGEARVYCLVVDGEPGSGGADQCFHQALLQRVGDDGELTSDPSEPIAADVRTGKDGRRLALLKLKAGLLGVDLDVLRQREQLRRQRQLIAVSAASLAGMALTGWLAWTATMARNDAERRQEQAENLIEFMLTDLRERLESVGRLDVLEAVGDEAMAYFSDLQPRDLTDESVARRAQALRQLGEVAFSEQRWDDARQGLQRSRAMLEELATRRVRDAEVLFELAQVVYWQGYVEFERGDYAATEPHFSEYQRLAVRMRALEPGERRWQLESIYAATNLAALREAQGRPTEALAFVDQAVAEMQGLAATSDEFNLRRDLAELLGWQSTIRLANGDFTGALTARQANHDIVQDLSERAPDDFQQRVNLAWTKRGLGHRLYDVGQFDLALATLAEAEALLRRATEHDPSNARWRWEWLRIRYEHERGQVQIGRTSPSVGSLQALEREVSGQGDGSPDGATYARLHSELLGLLALALFAEQPEVAFLKLTEARTRLQSAYDRARHEDPDHWSGDLWLDWVEAQVLGAGHERRTAMIRIALEEHRLHGERLDTTRSRIALARLALLHEQRDAAQSIIRILEAGGFAAHRSLEPLVRQESIARVNFPE